MIVEWDMQEAARLLDRARDLLRPHRQEQAGLDYFERTLSADAVALQNMARIRRENAHREGLRLFA